VVPLHEISHQEEEGTYSEQPTSHAFRYRRHFQDGWKIDDGSHWEGNSTNEIADAMAEPPA